MKSIRPTIKAIATELGISPTTVSFVLNGRDKGISSETAERIIRTAVAMGYIRSSRMHMKNWQRVVYVVDQISTLTTMTTFYQEVYNHLQSICEANQIEIIMRELNLNALPEAFFRQHENMVRQDFDIYLTHNRKIAEMLQANNCKVILCQSGTLPGMICIYCDDFMAGWMAAEHAVKQGHRTAGTIFFKGCHDSPRYHGFCDYFIKNGGIMPENFRWEVPANHEQAALIITGNTRIALRTKNTLPTLFYCFADNIMFPAIRGFHANGLAIPDQISLIGTDNLYWGKIATPAFSTVDLQESLFAAKLLQAIKDAETKYEPYQLAVPVQLCPRETVKKIN